MGILMLWVGTLAVLRLAGHFTDPVLSSARYARATSEAEPGPAVIAGDFNNIPAASSPRFRALGESGFHNALKDGHRRRVGSLLGCGGPHTNSTSTRCA
jgi:hypothetical protein